MPLAIMTGNLPQLTLLETDRLIIRAFNVGDLTDIHRILDQSFGDGSRVDDGVALRERESWLRWSILSEKWLPRLQQPPYGDRAITLKSTGMVIGAAGFVPLLAPFEQIAQLRASKAPGAYNHPEVGLYFVIEPAERGRGYATETAKALIEFAFEQLRLERILATTEFGNGASQAVMRKLGMTLTRNPLPEPAWMQVVGVLHNPR